MKAARLLPQIGALLAYDGAQDDDRYRGSMDWALKGSCTLVGAEMVLGLEHTGFLDWRNMAVFLPGQKIIPLGSDPLFEPGQPAKDRVALFRLARAVLDYSPLRWLWAKRKTVKTVSVHGCGSWGVGTQSLSGGVQRGFEVGTVHNDRYHHLDLQWAPSENGGLNARAHNSGGPVLWHARDEPVVVGVNRTYGDDLEISSRISECRSLWLNSQLRRRWAKQVEPLGVAWRAGQLLGDGPAATRFVIAAPPKATQVHVTLCATTSCELQMGVCGSPAPQGFLEAVARDPRAVGQFLYREASLEPGTKEVTVGVALFSGAVGSQQKVEIQLCVRFS